jgi:hypothetical protein
MACEGVYYRLYQAQQRRAEADRLDEGAASDSGDGDGEAGDVPVAPAIAGEAKQA